MESIGTVEDEAIYLFQLIVAFIAKRIKIWNCKRLKKNENQNFRQVDLHFGC